MHYIIELVTEIVCPLQNLDIIIIVDLYLLTRFLKLCNSYKLY